jgi:DNA-binding CsgD family transcriptional regulator
MARKKSAKAGRAAGRKKAGAGKSAGAKARKRLSKRIETGRPSKIHLTPREEEILRLVSLGCTVKEAAAILGVAPSTADNHKARLMAKLGTDKAALLTRLAIKHGVSSMQDTLDASEKRRSGRSQDGWN